MVPDAIWKDLEGSEAKMGALEGLGGQILDTFVVSEGLRGQILDTSVDSEGLRGQILDTFVDYGGSEAKSLRNSSNLGHPGAEGTGVT